MASVPRTRTKVKGRLNASCNTNTHHPAFGLNRTETALTAIAPPSTFMDMALRTIDLPPSLTPRALRITDFCATNTELRATNTDFGTGNTAELTGNTDLEPTITNFGAIITNFETTNADFGATTTDFRATITDFRAADTVIATG
ncbi:MAG TPA: hypothetical protein VH988_09805, partial [Thermoanaerobaculia bacterium]|nr:hypothetical protein [Thermoanaerobaculia bacterium]